MEENISFLMFFLLLHLQKFAQANQTETISKWSNSLGAPSRTSILISSDSSDNGNDANSTSTTTQRVVYNWHVLFLSIFSITGAFGNILVCMTIRRDSALQTKTNYYLFSLAIADLAVCLIVIPLSIIQDFSDKWIFSPYLCTFWVFSDLLLCTSSIYHLSSVSILRFIAIQYPLKSNRTISTNQTFLVLATIWLVSTLFSTITIYLGDRDINNVMDVSTQRCGLKHEKFIIYGSIFSFVIPLLIMIIMFSLMVRKLRRQLRKLDNASPQQPPHISDSNSSNKLDVPTTNNKILKKSPSEGMKDSLGLKVFRTQSGHERGRSIMVDKPFKSSSRNFSSSPNRRFTWRRDPESISHTHHHNGGCDAIAPIQSKRRAFRASRSNTLRSTFNSSISSNNSTQIMCGGHMMMNGCGGSGAVCGILNNDDMPPPLPLPQQTPPRFSQLLLAPQPSQPLLGPIVRKPSCYDSSSLRRSMPINNRNSYAKNSFLGHLSRLKVQSEVKALRVLGIVFIAFIVAWLPFCLLNIVTALLGIYSIHNANLNDALIYLTYLGYFQSTFNPIIYTVFNQKFRRNFIEILKCKKKKSTGFQKNTT